MKATLKIYSAADEKIRKYLNEFVAEYKFTPDEIHFKILGVEEKKVVFEIHGKLKTLVEEQFTSEEQQFHQLSFKQKIGSLWEIEIRSGGVESHFFAMLLEKVAKKLKKGKGDHIQKNKATIIAKIKELSGKISVHHEVYYKKGVYHVTVHVAKPFFLACKDCDISEICSLLDRKLPDLIQIASK